MPDPTDAAVQQLVARVRERYASSRIVAPDVLTLCDLVEAGAAVAVAAETATREHPNTMYLFRLGDAVKAYQRAVAAVRSWRGGAVVRKLKTKPVVKVGYFLCGCPRRYAYNEGQQARLHTRKNCPVSRYGLKYERLVQAVAAVRS